MRLFERTILLLMPLIAVACLFAYMYNTDLNMVTFITKLQNLNVASDKWWNGIYWINKIVETWRNPVLEDFTNISNITDIFKLLFHFVNYALTPLYFITAIIFYIVDILKVIVDFIGFFQVIKI